MVLPKTYSDILLKKMTKIPYTSIQLIPKTCEQYMNLCYIVSYIVSH